MQNFSGGDDDVCDADGLAIDILDGDLRLRVGAEPFRGLAGFANLRELPAEAVSKHDRRGHELGRFVARVAEHDSLVAGSLLGGLFAFGFLGVNALCDVLRLRGQVVVDEECVGVENVVVVHVSNAAHRVADDLADIDHLVDRLGGAGLLVLQLRNRDFSADYDDVAFRECLASHAARFVHRKAGVENGVGNRVADFVRMAFTNGL
jgi:hypothetical protein